MTENVSLDVLIATIVSPETVCEKHSERRKMKSLRFPNPSIGSYKSDINPM